MGRRSACLALLRTRGFGPLLRICGLAPQQLPACQPGAGRRGVLGLAVEVSLTLELAHVAQRLSDRGGLDPLCRDRHRQPAAEGHDRLDKLVADPFFSQFGDEAAVDLEAVERQRAQLRETGVAGAEIVEADPDALVL